MYLNTNKSITRSFGNEMLEKNNLSASLPGTTLHLFSAETRLHAMTVEHDYINLCGNMVTHMIIDTQKFEFV